MHVVLLLLLKFTPSCHPPLLVFGACPGCSACGCRHLVVASSRQHHLHPLSPPPIQHRCSYLSIAASSPVPPLPQVHGRLIFPMRCHDDTVDFLVLPSFSAVYVDLGTGWGSLRDMHSDLPNSPSSLYVQPEVSLFWQWGFFTSPVDTLQYIQKCLHLPGTNLGECLLASSWSKAMLVPTYAPVTFTAARMWQNSTARAPFSCSQPKSTGVATIWVWGKLAKIVLFPRAPVLFLSFHLFLRELFSKGANNLLVFRKVNIC